MRERRTKAGRVLAMALAMAAAAVAGWAAEAPKQAAALAQAQAWYTMPAGGAAPRPADDASLAQWWAVFHDPLLSSLEERALKANLDLRTAVAAINQARANRLSASGNVLPSLTVTGSGTGARSATNGGSYTMTGTGGSTQTVSAGGVYSQSYGAEFNASWEPDFFGSLRKTVAAYDADIQTAQENLRNAMVTLTAELAQDYVNVRSYQAQLEVDRSNLVKYRSTYEMTRDKAASGLASELDVEQALEQVQSTEAAIPALETSLRQNEFAIDTLVAERPGATEADLDKAAAIPEFRGEIAVGIPADLLRRRPDVRAAERQVAAEALRLGVAKANLYPTFTLSGVFQFTSSRLWDVLTPAALSSSVVGSVEQTLLNRRSLKAQVKLQDALLDQYDAAYDKAVLTAASDVENALQALNAEQTRQKSLAEASKTANNAAEMSHELYSAGLKDFLTVLDSERTALSMQSSLVESNAQVALDLVQLYKAMGGGWQ